MDDDLLKTGRDIFQRCEDAEQHNRETGLSDLRFSRLLEQWPQHIKDQREAEGRPCLTISKMNAFIRQVVNDARQNKPAIKVHPVDDTADKDTAKVINGLMRNIERTSKADLAYDTAIECAVTCGFGYIRVSLDYTHDDSFDFDLTIDRIANPFSVYGDPDSNSADGSDWNNAFIVERLSKEEFERKYGDKAQVDWDSSEWNDNSGSWRTDEGVMVAEWWHREEVQDKIHQVTDGETTRVFSEEQITTDPDVVAALEAGLLKVVRSRDITRHKVTQRFMTGFEILEENEWPGKYIPIVPVYGDEFDVEGKRYFRSLIHNAKDAQQMHNFWRTNATELVALAPRVPYIGEEGAFDVDPGGWATANTQSHAYLEYSKGKAPPQRQPLDSGAAAGSLQEALAAADDMKAIIGIYDASLGARSNETSGVAIKARQREGDVSTFHFIDNLTRAIRQLGYIVLDLIPHVYDAPRVVRVLGDDDAGQDAKINEPYPKMNEKGEPETDDMGQAIMAMHDLTVGKYDLTVSAGPSFTTRREEAAYEMTEAIRSVPAFGPILIDKLAKAQDWPDSEEIAERAKSLVPDPNAIPPQIQEALQRFQMMEQEFKKLQEDRSIELAELRLKAAEVEVKQQEAMTKRFTAEANVAEKADKQEIEFSQIVTNQ